ncbi:hypothetical protein H5410_057362 [Solanum commersonii]|uniref:Uncharacterized protein n=1 Tax=Solanum commersonii TaxID=4109 RepID=A0A9J5WPY4_SOLCO|nr:hypothetical protein H5410_057362 [Solanum commersonii]
MLLSIFSKINKARKAMDFERKGIFLEYDLQCELMERTARSATIEERHELHKKFLADGHQLAAEVNLNFTNVKVVKLNQNFNDNGSLKVFLAMKISMEIAYYKIIDLIKKEGKTVDFKRKKIFLEYDLQSELMERTTSSATIEERHELHKKILADCDQLTAEVNFNFTKYEFMKCSSKLIINFIQPFSFAVSKVVKLSRNFEDNGSLKVVLAMEFLWRLHITRLLI